MLTEAEVRPMAVQTNSKMSPMSLRILQELEDGEWHLYDDVVEAVQYMLPPGEAFRIGQEISNAAPGTRSMDDLIASGRRSKATEMINNVVANGRVERNTTKRNAENKALRLIRPISHVYVVRTDDGELSVHTWNRNNVDVAVHVIDALGPSDTPEEDAKKVKEIMQNLPRMPDRERILSACRHVINKLNVAATMRNFDRQFGTQSPSEDRKY